ncbi:hypothetical protein FDC58_17690 [Clostridium botulinum]|nr:hypothetical protein [Clostridium botulinum]NFP31023.1 hypothetical protein [Clostridium botulinum]
MIIKIKKIKLSTKCDLLLILGIIIIIATTIKLNIYVGMYMLGIILICMSFFMYKFSERG